MKKLLIWLLIAFSSIVFSQVQWRQVSTLGMGYVDGLLINPNTNQKFVRTDVGGIFKYENSNQKWVNITDKITTINQREIASVEAFAINNATTSLNQKIYALCGNSNNTYFIKSINGGNTWTVNQNWNTSIKVIGNGDWRCSGEKIGIDPNNPNIIYCGTRENGLLRSVDDATNWTTVSNFTYTTGTGGLTNIGGISFVVFDPNSTILVNGQTVSKNIYIGVIDGGVYRSNDGGQSFCQLSGGFNASFYNPVRAIFSNNKLIVTLMSDGDIYDQGEVWAFTPDANNCTGSWQDKTPGANFNYGCPVYGKYLYNAVTVKPNDPNTVFLAIRGAMPRKIFYSENFHDAIPTWKILTLEPNTNFQSCLSTHKQVTFTTPESWVETEGYDWTGNIMFDQIDNKKIWMTSGNGIKQIIDYTVTNPQITAISVMKDLEILCVNDIAAPPAPNTKPLVTAAMDVLGTVYNDLDNANLTELDPSFGLGSGISLSFSFQNPNHLVLVGQNYNNPVVDKRVIKSTDGGTSWQSIWTTTPNCTDAPWGGNIVISSTNPNNIVWVPSNTSNVNGCGNIVKNYPRYTTNGGANWNTCNTINFPDGNFPFSFSSTFGIAKNLESDKVNGNKYYYYAMEGNTFVPKLYRSTDGGANWSVMSTGVLPITGGGQLKANPYIENDIWFSPFNNYILNNDPNPNLRKLWRSQDGGATWTTIAGMDEVYAFGFGKNTISNPNALLFVHGKRLGIENLYFSTDLGETFISMGMNNFPTGLIANIEGDFKEYGKLFIATGCRGVWYGNSLEAILLNSDSFANKQFKIYPNPSYNFIHISGNTIPEKIVLYDVQGRLLDISNTYANQKLDISNLNSGTYYLVLSFDNKKETHQILKN
jgi:xyloglucan-specific exo-beta-1,4-glucanase